MRSLTPPHYGAGMAPGPSRLELVLIRDEIQSAEIDECSEGDLVRIVETRPLSKTKRWNVKEIETKAK